VVLTEILGVLGMRGVDIGVLGLGNKGFSGMT